MWKTSAVAGLVALAATVASGQTLPQHDGRVHLGVATCASSQCHGSSAARAGAGILQTEYVAWTNADPHARAYATLMLPESAAIAARLGIGRAAEAEECLNCHADNVPPALRGERFQISDGVGCEACHGGAGDWLVSHYNDLESARAASVAAGLYPADARARATLCLSCHQGTSSKLATHRLMAAGHPRLAFELDTFTELWRLAGRPPHFEMDADYAERKPMPDHTATWIVGLIATAMRQLELLGGPALRTGGAFPELALFDCHACHRTMKEVAWRSLPRYGGVGPGNPLPNDSSLVMLIAVARGLERAEAAALEESVRALHRATTRGTDAIQEVARAFAADLVALEASVAGLELSAAQKRRVLGELGAAARAGEFLDYAAAEQAFMAVQLLAFDLEDEALASRIERLAAEVQDGEAYDPARFMRLLSELTP
jgi:hypothetical protein